MEYWRSGSLSERVYTVRDYRDIEEDEEREIVLPAVNYGSLDAGEAISRETSWPIDEMDPNGIYTVEASFFPGRQDEKRYKIIEELDYEERYQICQIFTYSTAADCFCRLCSLLSGTNYAAGLPAGGGPLPHYRTHTPRTCTDRAKHRLVA